MDITGGAHIHSRYSYDGAVSLADLRKECLARDMRFALMAEHTDHLMPEAAEEFIRECRRLSDAEFILIPGFEVSYLGTHVLVIGASRYHHGQSAAELLMRWRAEGALLVLAHPHRNGYRMDHFLREQLDGIEIWNSQYDGIWAPRTRAWDMLPTMVSSVRAFGSLDLHRFSHINGPRLAMTVAALDEADIIARLRQGAFSIRRGKVSVLSDGTLFTGNLSVIRLMGILMPAFVSFLRACSSLAGRLGVTSLPLKKWLRAHV